MRAPPAGNVNAGLVCSGSEGLRVAPGLHFGRFPGKAAGVMLLMPDSIEAVCDAVRGYRCVLACGGGTKPALSRAPDGVAALCLRGLSGMVEYEPDEYTFTALAGTPVAAVQAELARHGQYLPFDPPLAAEGATLGGTVAAGMSGAGRMRYGGVRDFIVGVRWVDASGTVIRGGGKVVKNAAGFDFPKLFTGSLGRLGVLVEMTFKVFPAPVARVTCRIDTPDLTEALRCMNFLCNQPWEVEAVELTVAGNTPQLLVRFMGDEPALTQRAEMAVKATGCRGEILAAHEAAAIWQSLDSLAIGETGAPLAKVPLTPGRIAPLEAALAGHGAVRHYSTAGNAAWISGLEAGDLHPLLSPLALGGLMLRGAGPSRTGHHSASVMEAKVKAAMDPEGKFPAL